MPNSDVISAATFQWGFKKKVAKVYAATIADLRVILARRT
jgi:hypothetical protein